MNSLLEAVILGIVQGLTEFLPISSSGHLEIAKYLLGDDQLGEQSLLMTITLHAATALATIVVYRNDVQKLVSGAVQRKSDELRYLWLIVLSMIPAVAIGVFFESEIEGLFSQNMTLIAWMLVITGILLLCSEYLRRGSKPLGGTGALLVGIAQAFAILPGISRSGATISVALLLGIDRTRAARFSFLMVIPLIFGKMVKELIDGDFNDEAVRLLPLLLGAVVAFITGWIACKWIISIVQHARLHYFAFYCFFVAVLLWVI